MTTIHFLEHDEIDFKSWDECVSNSPECRIYGMSWYLDVVCPGWTALITQDYNTVFPLPVKTKLGISYSFHPLFAQQLGRFSTVSNPPSLDDFLKAIPKKFKRTNLQLNVSGATSAKESLQKRRNLILKLNDTDYRKNYNQNTKRNVAKARKYIAEINAEIPITDFIALKRRTLKADITATDKQRMEELLAMLDKQNYGQVYGVVKDEALIAGVFLAEWQDRLYYLFAASDETAKELRASFRIVDEIIAKYAGSGKILDFEGSVDDNLAFFFNGFGSEEETYYTWKKTLRL